MANRVRPYIRRMENALRGLVLGFVVALAACGGGGDAQTATTQSPSSASAPAVLRVFIFGGQSTMLGSDALIAADGTSDLADVGQQTDADRSTLFSFNSHALRYEWGAIRGHDGYHYGEPLIAGKPVKVHGPEVGFARAMGGNIAIIKYADNFFELENGHSPWVKPGTRWAAWQAFIDEQLAALGKPYVIAGFIWDQGIDDALCIRTQEEYAADLRQMAADLRAKFGNKPFILARSVNSQIAGNVAMAPIRAGQAEVGGEPGNGWIDLDDLGPYVAIQHLTASSEIVSGQRFAAAFNRSR